MCECLEFTADIDKPNRFLLFFRLSFSSIVVVVAKILLLQKRSMISKIVSNSALDSIIVIIVRCGIEMLCVCVAIIHSNALALVRSPSFTIDKTFPTITINRAPTNQHHGVDSILRQHTAETKPVVHLI